MICLVDRLEYIYSDIRLTPLWKLATLRNILFVRVDVCGKSNNFEETKSVMLAYASSFWVLGIAGFLQYKFLTPFISSL